MFAGSAMKVTKVISIRPNLLGHSQSKLWGRGHAHVLVSATTIEEPCVFSLANESPAKTTLANANLFHCRSGTNTAALARARTFDSANTAPDWTAKTTITIRHFVR